MISSGYANRFGHPHADVVARLWAEGATVYGTAGGGALEFEFAPGEPVRVTQPQAAGATLLDVTSVCFLPLGPVRIMTPLQLT